MTFPYAIGTRIRYTAGGRNRVGIVVSVLNGRKPPDYDDPEAQLGVEVQYDGGDLVTFYEDEFVDLEEE